MTLSPITTAQFGGLNFADPYKIGWSGAIDQMDVDIDRSGLLRSRHGLSAYVTPTSTTAINYICGHTDAFNTGPRLIVSYTDGVGPKAQAYKWTDETTVGGAYTLSNSITSQIVYGTPGLGATFSYIACNGQVDATPHTLLKFDGTTFTGISPANLLGPVYVTLSPSDNRLVVAEDKERVAFSDAGAPETFGANNNLRLDPGDGDSIRGVANWGNLVFVFKQRRFYVFYTTDTDQTGNPIFRYRKVDHGVGTATNPQRCVAPEGVYFWDLNLGLMLTSGGQAQRVSDALDPLRQGVPLPYFTGALDADVHLGRSGPQAMCYWQGRVYMTWTQGVLDAVTYLPRTLVYDTQTKNWLLWSFGGNTLYGYDSDTGASSSTNYKSRLLLDHRLAATRSVFRLDPAATDDAGTAINSRYRAGFSDLGRPDKRRKAIRQWMLRGSGNVNFAVAADSATAIPTTAGGAKGQVALADPGFYRTAQRGRDFSWYVESVSGGAWTLNDLTAQVSA